MKFLSAEGLQKLLSKLKTYILSAIGEESQRLRQSIALPVGTVIHTAASSAPEGFLVCGGQAVSRTEYAELYAVIGTKYGTGNGSTTFNVPNLIDRFIEGASSGIGTSVSAGLPNITGSFGCTVPGKHGNTARGAFSGTSYAAGTVDATAVSGTSAPNTTIWGYDIDASRVSSVYGASSTVQPPAVKMLPCIKAVK